MIVGIHRTNEDMCIPSLQEIIMPGWTTFLRRTYTEILIPGEESMKHLMNRRVTALDKSQYPWPTTTFRPLIGLDESEPWSCVPFLDPFYHQLLCPPLIGYLQLANSLSSFFPFPNDRLKTVKEHEFMTHMFVPFLTPDFTKNWLVQYTLIQPSTY